MKIDTRALDKIHRYYDADHDSGPEAPVQWGIEDLAHLVGRLVEVIEKQQEQIEALQDAVPSAFRP